MAVVGYDKDSNQRVKLLKYESVQNFFTRRADNYVIYDVPKESEKRLSLCSEGSIAVKIKPHYGKRLSVPLESQLLDENCEGLYRSLDRWHGYLDNREKQRLENMRTCNPHNNSDRSTSPSPDKVATSQIPSRQLSRTGKECYCSNNKEPDKLDDYCCDMDIKQLSNSSQHKAVITELIGKRKGKQQTKDHSSVLHLCSMRKVQQQQADQQDNNDVDKKLSIKNGLCDHCCKHRPNGDSMDMSQNSGVMKKGHIKTTRLTGLPTYQRIKPQQVRGVCKQARCPSVFIYCTSLRDKSIMQKKKSNSSRFCSIV